MGASSDLVQPFCPRQKNKWVWLGSDIRTEGALPLSITVIAKVNKTTNKKQINKKTKTTGYWICNVSLVRINSKQKYVRFEILEGDRSAAVKLSQYLSLFFPRQRRDRRTQHFSSATRPGCGRGWSVTSRDLHRGPELQQGAICGLHCVGGAVRHHH